MASKQIREKFNSHRSKETKYNDILRDKHLKKGAVNRGYTRPSCRVPGRATVPSGESSGE